MNTLNIAGEKCLSFIRLFGGFLITVGTIFLAGVVAFLVALATYLLLEIVFLLCLVPTMVFVNVDTIKTLTRFAFGDLMPRFAILWILAWVVTFVVMLRHFMNLYSMDYDADNNEAKRRREEKNLMWEEKVRRNVERINGASTIAELRVIHGDVEYQEEAYSALLKKWEKLSLLQIQSASNSDEILAAYQDRPPEGSARDLIKEIWESHRRMFSLKYTTWSRRNT